VAIKAKSPTDPRWLVVLLDADPLCVLDDAPAETIVLVVPGAVVLAKMELVLCGAFATWSPTTAIPAMAMTKSATTAIAVVFMPDAKVAGSKRNPVKRSFLRKRNCVPRLQILQEGWTHARRATSAGWNDHPVGCAE